MDIVGQIVAGRTAKILVREKSGEKIELGDLLISEEAEGYLILQVSDLSYASQISQSSRELLAGLNLEGFGAELDFLEPELRNYIIAESKAIAYILKKEKGKFEVRMPKTLPKFFNSLRQVRKEDLAFLEKPDNPVYLGEVRSGSKILDVGVYLNCEDVFTHHILVPATTGRGKSNLVKVLLWSVLGQGRIGTLVLDPHDEYYGRHDKGLKDHPNAKDSLKYYSPLAPPGANTLVINLSSIRPGHFSGIVSFTSAQRDAIQLYYNQFHDEWISQIARGTALGNVMASTLGVLQRKFDNILGVYVDEDRNIQCRTRVFSDTQGQSSVDDITRALEDSKTVIIDTSKLLGEAELLIGSIIAGRIFNRYRNYKSQGNLNDKPVISIVIEEAPRVLGKEALEGGGNIYGTIAKEGRKFRTGLLAITQLTSLIPRTVLANINTKIILGNEMALERAAIISSASQDLSSDDRAIASLDKGEAIVTTNFTKFAVPIQVPLFEDYIKKIIPKKETKKEKPVFVG